MASKEDPLSTRSSQQSAQSTKSAGDHSIAAIRAHKGHRNLFVRGCATVAQLALTIALIPEKEENSIVAVFQFLSACTLFVQWRTGNPWMFVGRGCCSWALCIVFVRQSICGTGWLWEFGSDCNDKAWDNSLLKPLRVLTLCAALRIFFNGVSLFCQFTFPQRMFWNHGNEQLFYRGCIQFTGVPIHILRYVFKLDLHGTPFERIVLEELGHFIRIAAIIISSGSLINQWWLTGKGHTGHPLSNAFENLRADGHGLGETLAKMHGAAHDLKQKAQERARRAKEGVRHATNHLAHAVGHGSPKGAEHMQNGMEEHDKQTPRKEILEI